MYFDRNEIWFRKEDEKDFITKNQLTIFRPGNRIYPQKKWFTEWEVVKARILDKPWDDIENRIPVLSKIVKLVKIQAIKILNQKNLTEDDFASSLAYIQSQEDVKRYIENIYKENSETITKIDIENLNTQNLIDNTNEIKELFTSWNIKFSTLPENNIMDINELLSAKNFSLTFVNHDYAGITPKMWNHIAKHYDLDIKNAMVITQPENFEKNIEVLKKSNKYIWGGFGVGFKDFGRNIIKDKSYWFINPVANEMQSINFVAHFWEEIHGYNSDASWYVDSLCDKFKEIWSDIQEKNIILLWAWWTARWIALELVNRWINSIVILNRTVEKAEHIAQNLNRIKQNIAKAWTEDAIYELQNKKIDAIINLSTKGADGDFEKYSWLTTTEWGVEKNIQETKNILQTLKEKNPHIIISDINLTKHKTTPFLEEAKILDLPTLDGQLMVVYQWVQAIWTVFWDKIIEVWGTKEEVQKELLRLIFGANNQK